MAIRLEKRLYRRSSSNVIRGLSLLAVGTAAIGAGATVLSLAYHATDQHFSRLFAQQLPEADRVSVDKSERSLSLIRGKELLKTYRISLGANPRGPKETLGDSRTPEGEYTIDWRLEKSDFHRALHVSYPNAEDRKFAAAIGRSPGGAIMIHGQPNDLSWIERMTRPADWTDGCIAVSNTAIDELWEAIPVGTPITIRP